MNRQPLLILALIAIGSLFCLNGFSQSSYDDYSLSDKTYKYREDFNSDGSVFWDTYEEGRRSATVKDGVLDFQSFNDKTQVKYSTVDMNWSGDWELEIGVRWVSGKETSAVDFIWDKEAGNTDKFHFGFTAGRKYVIAEYKNSQYNHIAQFIPANYVYKSSRNRLTVRKVRQNYYLFFNERLVKTMDYQPVKGDMIGITTPPGTRIMVDYIYGFELDTPSSSSSSSSSASDPTLLSGDNYVGVMTKYNGYNLQRWKTRDNFPKDDIKKDWDDGFYVTDASYDNSKWSIVTSKGTGYTNQTWITRKEWPKDEIKEKWDEGYKMTEVAYGNGVYAIVFSKGSGYGRQRWSTRGSEFPSDKIKEYADEGLSITEAIYSDDRWVLVGSKDSGIQQQKWFKRKIFPKDEIDQNTKEGYAITQLSQENGWWMLIMSKYSGNKPTIWFNTASFPKEEIRKYWDQGYYLTDITYGTTVESTSSTTASYTLSDNTTSTTRDLKTRLIGNWYGGDGDGDNGYLKFYNDGIIRMISGGDTIGGYDYTQDGVKIEVKYEIDSYASPNQLDIVFYSGGNSFGTMKGIVRFIDDDTFEFKLATELNDPRPSSFSSSDGNKTATFKRQD